MHASLRTPHNNSLDVAKVRRNCDGTKRWHREEGSSVCKCPHAQDGLQISHCGSISSRAPGHLLNVPCKHAISWSVLTDNHIVVDHVSDKVSATPPEATKATTKLLDPANRANPDCQVRVLSPVMVLKYVGVVPCACMIGRYRVVSSQDVMFCAKHDAQSRSMNKQTLTFDMTPWGNE